MCMYAYVKYAHTYYTRIRITHTHNVCIHCKEIPYAYNLLIEKGRENAYITHYTHAMHYTDTLHTLTRYTHMNSLSLLRERERERERERAYIHYTLHIYTTRNTHTLHAHTYTHIHTHAFPLSFERERERQREREFTHYMLHTYTMSGGIVLVLQGGEDSLDALSCESFSAKQPLIIGLFCGK